MHSRHHRSRTKPGKAHSRRVCVDAVDQDQLHPPGLGFGGLLNLRGGVPGLIPHNGGVGGVPLTLSSLLFGLAQILLPAVVHRLDQPAADTDD